MRSVRKITCSNFKTPSSSKKTSIKLSGFNPQTRAEKLKISC
jgi:hypothetical protein